MQEWYFLRLITKDKYIRISILINVFFCVCCIFWKVNYQLSSSCTRVIREARDFLLRIPVLVSKLTSRWCWIYRHCNNVQNNIAIWKCKRICLAFQQLNIMKGKNWNNFSSFLYISLSVLIVCHSKDILNENKEV